MIFLRGLKHLCRRMELDTPSVPIALKKMSLKEFLPEYGQPEKTTECVVCASRGLKNAKHRHFSSAYQRIVKIKDGAGLLECPICRASHPIGIMCTTRLKCIFASSTLHNSFQSKHWEGTGGFHVDVETICGARISMGKVQWEATYYDCPMNIDTHVVMGLNDLIAMTKSEPSDTEVSTYHHFV